MAGTSMMVPLEQEVARAVAVRRAVDDGAQPVVWRALQVGGLTVVAVSVLLAVVGATLAAKLFDGNKLFVVCLAMLWAGYAAEHLARGILAGTQRYRAYAVVLSVEGVVRVGAAGIVALVGVHRPLVLGVVIAVSPIVAVLAVSRGLRVLGEGSPARWSEVSSRVGLLTLASLAAQALAALPPVVVIAWSDRSTRAAAGAFFAGATLARIPLFLFTSVQAVLLPRLAAFISAGRVAEFRSGIARLLILVVGIATISTLVVAAVGADAVRVLFGSGFRLTRTDLVALVVGVGLHLVAVVLVQGLLALHSDGRAAVSWLAGLAVFFSVAPFGHTLLGRAERAFIAGEAAAVLLASVFLVARSRRHAAGGMASLIEELGEAGRSGPSLAPQT